MEAIIRTLAHKKARVVLLGRQLGWFAGIWAMSVGALFIVATVIRLATGH